MSYPSLAKAEVEIAVDRSIIMQKTVHQTRIGCQWTDGERGCCETWKHDGPRQITRRDAFYLAGADGWILIKGMPVCPCHQDDEDPELRDLEKMVKYLKSIGA